jgi:hypothetical protein
MTLASAQLQQNAGEFSQSPHDESHAVRFRSVTPSMSYKVSHRSLTAQPSTPIVRVRSHTSSPVTRSGSAQALVAASQATAPVATGKSKSGLLCASEQLQDHTPAEAVQETFNRRPSHVMRTLQEVLPTS